MTVIRTARALGLVALFAVAPALAQERKAVNTRAEYLKFDPDYRAKLGAQRKRVETLQTDIHALESSGAKARCAAQMLAELRWRVSNTADYVGVEKQITTLADEMSRLRAGGGDRSDAQDASDGAWGRCYTEWFFRLDASYDAISELAGRAPPARAAFLDRVNDPDALEAELMRLFASNIAADGINRRRAYNTVLSDVMRLILNNEPAGYVWKDGVRERLLTLLRGPLRNPASGLWGVRQTINGEPVFVDDLSITFHVVKYLGGDVEDWPKIIDGLLAIRDLPYPQGWRQDDGYLNHDIYDVTTLLRMGWGRANESQRATVRGEMKRLLDWSLANTIRPDGSVALHPNDDSVETSYYFAVGFLDEVGYFDPAKRFWTDESFPQGPALAAALRERIEAALKAGSGGEGGVYYRGALKRLAAAAR